jgi:hypothetical protein
VGNWRFVLVLPTQVFTLKIQQVLFGKSVLLVTGRLPLTPVQQD